VLNKEGVLGEPDENEDWGGMVLAEIDDMPLVPADAYEKTKSERLCGTEVWCGKS
jgi:hypothetical protein